MTWQQFLTEKVLGEPKATSEYTVANNGDLVSVKTVIKDRTFTNRNDLMDLYQKIYEDGKWGEFDREDVAVLRWIDCETARHATDSDYDAWLFCLDGKGYEDRCKMVAEFYGWKEKV